MYKVPFVPCFRSDLHVILSESIVPELHLNDPDYPNG
jgi:hypothetical protein